MQIESIILGESKAWEGIANKTSARTRACKDKLRSAELPPRLKFHFIFEKKIRKEHFGVTIREFGLFEVFSQKTITVVLFTGYYQPLTENTIRSNFDGEYFSKVG